MIRTVDFLLRAVLDSHLSIETLHERLAEGILCKTRLGAQSLQRRLGIFFKVVVDSEERFGAFLGALGDDGSDLRRSADGGNRSVKNR